MENNDISSTVVETGEEETNDIAPVRAKEKKRKHMSKEYNREWYHKHKTDIKCQWCSKTYACKSSLTRLHNRSTTCFVAKIKQEWEETNGNTPMTLSDLKNVMDTWMRTFKEESQPGPLSDAK